MHCFQGVWCYGHNGIYSKQEYDAIFIYWADESLGNMIDVYVKGITDKETYLMRKESYEVMISGIKEKIAAQKEAVYVLENQKPYDNRHSVGYHYGSVVLLIGMLLLNGLSWKLNKNGT